MYPVETHTPPSELENRIVRFQEILTQNHIDAAMILQKADLFYLCGSIQNAHLYVPARGEALLMVYKSLSRARAESAMGRIVALPNPGRIPALLSQNGLRAPDTLGLELDVLPANHYLRFQKMFPTARLRDVSPLIRRVRAVKSTYEIEQIRIAAGFADQVAAFVPQVLRAGMTEIELAGLVEAHARSLGHLGVIRMRMWGTELIYGHLMSGPRAAVPSYLASPTGGAAVSPALGQGSGFGRIRRNEPVLVDYVFAHNGYLADHTRIFCLGTPTPEMAGGHKAMLDIQARVQAAAMPGTPAGAVYDLALDRVAELGLGDNFMGADSDRVRFVGHGIGLELDEFPFLAQGQGMHLVAGMIVAVEPKLIFPGRGVVGIENTHLVTPDGLESLTHFEEDIIVV